MTGSGVKKAHLDEIDVALGITMCFVVFGHMYFISEAGVLWYETVRLFIYQFHMAVFYFIMGFLFTYTKDVFSRQFNHLEFCYRKGIKFAKPFLFFAIVYFMIDLILASDKSLYLASFRNAIYNQFIFPTRAPATFLWFIYVLFAYYLTIPLLGKLFRAKTMLVMTVIGIVLIFITLPPAFALELYGRYFIFFVFGMVYSTIRAEANLYINQFGWIFILMWTTFMIVYILTGWENSYLVSITAIVSILFLSGKIAKTSGIFNVIGRNVFPIYLQNTTIIGLLFILLTKVFKVQEVAIQYFIPLFILFAIIIPLALNRMIPNKLTFLRSLLGYI